MAQAARTGLVKVTTDPIDVRYTALVETGFPAEGFCLTWCQNNDVREVTRRFGADPEAGLWVGPKELEEEHWEDLLQLTPAGEWTLVFESPGFQGDREEVLEVLSAGGRALNVIWRGERDNRVTYAVDGDIITSFRLMDLSQRSGDVPSALDDLLEQVGLHDGLPVLQRKARILALAEALSGHPLTPEWVWAPRFAAVIEAPIPDALVPRAYLHPRESFLDEPEFARLLTDPSPATAPAITRLVVSIVTAGVGLEGHTLVEDTLRMLERGEASPAKREALRARLHQSAEETSQALLRQLGSTPDTAEAERLEQRGHALYALSKALSPSPVNAAYAVTDEAFRIPRLSRADFMRLHVLRNVADRILSEEMSHS
ncbi:DUF6461 domain-containing protein [Streptosporangium sp. NPDC023615]|uniref:DUF6461 domain-containing protein n=1 Tax=Streptosporangium sp. NPDC023615 TaxID=3154794 RepID=UPI003447DD5F